MWSDFAAQVIKHEGCVYVRACVCQSVTREGEREKGENGAGNSRGFAALALAFHTWSTAGLVYP